MVEKVDQAGKSEGHAVLLQAAPTRDLGRPAREPGVRMQADDGIFFEDFETEFKGDSQCPSIETLKGKGKGDLWSIFSNLRTVTIFIDEYLI